MLLDMRMCSECKVDVDMEVPFPCDYGTHKWHNPEDDSQDMCCECGLDWDVLLK